MLKEYETTVITYNLKIKTCSQVKARFQTT